MREKQKGKRRRVWVSGSKTRGLTTTRDRLRENKTNKGEIGWERGSMLCFGGSNRHRSLSHQGAKGRVNVIVGIMLPSCLGMSVREIRL